MGTLYKKTVTRQLPAGATITTNRAGERIAKWRSRNGKPQTAIVVDGTDGTLGI
ncbi:MAG: hypothetical protein R3E01_05695 [Pirellulaceae bacterium]